MERWIVMDANFKERVAFALDNVMLDGGKDAGAIYPSSDAADQMWGARFIPGEVTMARRAGQKVRFVRDCRCPNCWYWLFLDEWGFAPGELTKTQLKKLEKEEQLSPQSYYDDWGYNDYSGREIAASSPRSTPLMYKPGQKIMHFDPYWLTVLKEKGGKCDCGNKNIRGGIITTGEKVASFDKGLEKA
jgi:hypothetical protein